jgi:uncharacterized membrane protein YkoI
MPGMVPGGHRVSALRLEEAVGCAILPALRPRQAYVSAPGVNCYAMKKYWISAAILLLAAAIGAGAYLLGTHHSGQDKKHDHHEVIDFQGTQVIDLATAIELTLQKVQGDVLKVELENEDGRYVYEVKILATNGRVREVKLDAKDGSLIEIEDD